MTRTLTSLLAAALLATACTATSGTESDRPSEVNPSSTPPPSESWFRAACGLPADQLRRINRGLFPGRSPEVVIVPKAPHYFGTFSYTSHSGPWDYVQEVPLVFYGPGFIRAQGTISLDREVTVADLAPTLAELLSVRLPRRASGRAVTEALVPEAQRPGKPRLVLVVVWDGGGWNVLNRWPGAWPTFRSLMQKGASVADATVGSSPSVTPAIHANIGTGTFPRQHGIIDIPLRQGEALVAAYEGLSPQYLEVPSLGDVHDRATGNRANVGMLAERDWHLGMVGHGAFLPGGDKDVAVITGGDGALMTNPEFYSLPGHLLEVPLLEDDELRQVDAEDGRQDSAWMGHPIMGEDAIMLMRNPASVDYQTRLLKSLLDREGYGEDGVPDLFFTNYKQPDLIGHSWNMVNPEMRSILRHVDDGLKELVAFLESHVGERRWVLALTADHGQTPLPETTGAWPINMTEFQKDIARGLGLSAEELFQGQRITGLWIAPEAIARGIRPRQVAAAILDYRLGDNIGDGDHLPAEYQARRGERLFAAAFPSEATRRALRCALKE